MPTTSKYLPETTRFCAAMFDRVGVRERTGHRLACPRCCSRPSPAASITPPAADDARQRGQSARPPSRRSGRGPSNRSARPASAARTSARPSGLTPSGTCRIRWKLAISSPAPTSSTNASATCDTTSHCRSRICTPPLVDERLCSRSTSPGCVLAARSAGASPNPRALSDAMTSENSEQSRLERERRESRDRAGAESRRSPSSRTAPRRYPRCRRRCASVRLSMSVCRTSRRRSAPNAERSANSRARSDAAHEQQVREVHADQHEHQRHGAEHDLERPLDSPTMSSLSGSSLAPAYRASRIPLGQRRAESVELRPAPARSSRPGAAAR